MIENFQKNQINEISSFNLFKTDSQQKLKKRIFNL